MLIESSRVVTADSERPARKDGTCFYCRSEVGAPHDPTCVLFRRTVVVRTRVEHVYLAPQDWDPTMIEFQLNESSSCASNIVDALEDLFGSGSSRCMCFFQETEFVREATAEDHERFGLSESGSPLPSSGVPAEETRRRRVDRPSAAAREVALAVARKVSWHKEAARTIEELGEVPEGLYSMSVDLGELEKLVRDAVENLYGPDLDARCYREALAKEKNA